MPGAAEAERRRGGSLGQSLEWALGSKEFEREGDTSLWCFRLLPSDETQGLLGVAWEGATSPGMFLSLALP